MPGLETDKIRPLIDEYCTGLGVDFGCEVGAHPCAHVLVDRDQETYKKYVACVCPNTNEPYEVHIRDIDNGFHLENDEGSWHDGRFDFVLSSHTIEHLRNPRAFLSECLRLCKDGGYVIVAGPHKDWYWPVGHPDSNPDHARFNWLLDEQLIEKWLRTEAALRHEDINVICSREIGGYEGNWSFLVIIQKVGAFDGNYYVSQGTPYPVADISDAKKVTVPGSDNSSDGKPEVPEV